MPRPKRRRAPSAQSSRLVDVWSCVCSRQGLKPYKRHVPANQSVRAWLSGEVQKLGLDYATALEADGTATAPVAKAASKLKAELEEKRKELVRTCTSAAADACKCVGIGFNSRHVRSRPAYTCKACWDAFAYVGCEGLGDEVWRRVQGA